MRYGDMPSTIGRTAHINQPQMRCVDCLAGPFSAERGDYFMCHDDEEVTCGECNGDMELGRLVTTWETGGGEVVSSTLS